MTAQMVLPQPMNRNLFLAKQVDQASKMTYLKL